MARKQREKEEEMRKAAEQMQAKENNKDLDSQTDLRRDKSNMGNNSFKNLDNLESKKKDTANRRKSGVKEKDLVDIDENYEIKGSLVWNRCIERKLVVPLDEEIISKKKLKLWGLLHFRCPDPCNYRVELYCQS